MSWRVYVEKFDNRLVKVSIEINGKINTYDQSYNISISGSKYANANKNECEVKIANLSKNDRDYILTETSPFNLNKSPKSIKIEAGRESYGTTLVFSGNVYSSTVSQPPDIILSMKCMTKYFLGGDVITRAQGAQTSLKGIATGIAKDISTSLNFQATDKNVSNYTHTGSSISQVDKLGEMGNVDAYVDDEVLVVKDSNKALTNVITVLNLDTGMIGIPELTALGIKIKFLIDHDTKLGGIIRVTSKLYPTANGDYVIYKLGFDIESRDTAFYYTAEAYRSVRF